MEDVLHERLLRNLDGELHDLCQPLTTLLGRLELGQMMGDVESLKEAVDRGMVEAQRMAAAVERMRERLEQERQAWKSTVLGG